VIKKNGEKKNFDRDKLTKAISLAVRKRQISNEQIELVVNHLVRELESCSEAEIPTEFIGDLVMKSLARMDRVAYIRFASVYKDFSEIKDFEKFIKEI
jgi:transcriptional repressor NrdR